MTNRITQANDTCEAAERLQFRVWRERSSAEKLRLIGELCASTKHLALVGLRRRHPDSSDEELRMRLYSLWLGDDAMRRWYGWDPREH